MTPLWMTLAVLGGALYLAIAGGVGYLIYTEDADYWGCGDRRNASNYDTGTAAVFGFTLGMAWPLLLLCGLFGGLIVGLGAFIKSD